MTALAVRRAAAGFLAVAAAVGAGLIGAAPATEALDAQREQVRALESELSRIDTEAASAADAHAAAAQRLRALRGRIVANAGASRRAAIGHRAARERLAERLVAIYTRREPGPVEVLFATGDLSDAIALGDVQRRVARRDATLLADLAATRARLTRARRALESERADAARVADEARSRLAEVDALLGRRRLVLDRARGALDGLIARRDREAALARARAAAESATRRRARATTAATPAVPAAPATPPPARAPRSPVRRADGPIAGGPSYAVLARIAECESGGNPRAVSSSGQYRGKYQFDLSTWASVGGSGDPAAAPEAEQDMRAAMLYVQRGPAPWPICGYR